MFVDRTGDATESERRNSGTSPQYRAVASGMNLSLDVSHRTASSLRPPVHVGGTSSLPPSGAALTPRPVAIDMPSPASFDPLLEHFLRPVEPASSSACLFERGEGGKAIRLVLEEGNVPLLQAERSWSAYNIMAADGTRIASLSRASKGAVLTALSLPSTRAELAVYRLSECQLDHVPTKPTLNRMQLAMSSLPPDDGAPVAPIAKTLGRDAGELAASIDRPAPHCAQCESRLPAWDAARDLLTLDFPPGRALLASVQNFQLTLSRAADADRGRQQGAAQEAVLVHGLLSEAEDGVDTYSLDFAYPLSPLVAFAAVLAAQAWQ